MNIYGIHAAAGESGAHVLTDDGDRALEWPPRGALGQILGRYTGFDSAIARCRGSPEACEQGGRHGFRVFAPRTKIRAKSSFIIDFINNRRRGI